MFSSKKLREENHQLRHAVLLEQERTERMTGLYFGLRDALSQFGIHYKADTNSLVSKDRHVAL